LAFLKAQESRAETRWQSLGSPPEGAIEIVTGDAYVVYVRSDAGEIYGCRHNRGRIRSGICWMQTQEPLDIAPDTTFDEPPFADDVELPPGTVVDGLGATVWKRDASFETLYVVLQDGSVWKWEYSRVGYFNIIIVVLGLIAGGVLAIVGVVILWSGVGLRSLWQRITRKTPDATG
jgi:hypothetical protein